jgi:hypothetical protein
MLYRSMAEPYKVKGLTLLERKALLDKAADRILANIEEPCAAGPDGTAARPGAFCAPDDQRFTLHLRPPPVQEASDLAKQLLILVGTLMTSVTSFYFATRSAGSTQAQAPQPPDPQPQPQPQPPQGGPGADAAQPGAATADSGMQADIDAHADGCNVDITDPTPDEALPAATGGVAR